MTSSRRVLEHWERREKKRQRLRVRIEIETDIERAVESDDLSETVDLDI